MTMAGMTSQPRAREAPARPPTAAADSTRRYIYCIIDCDSPATFGQMGIGDNSEVFAVPHGGSAAVLSVASAEKLEITRGNALAHQRVMEAVMHRGHTVLPVRFNTVAEAKAGKTAEQRIIDHVLAGRRQEILGLLSRMRPYVELGVKGLWTGMETVFRDIAESSPEIRSLRAKLLSAGRAGTAGGRRGDMVGQIRLGEAVKKALEAGKSEMQAALLARLRPLAADLRANKTFGDPMFANLALLVEKSRQESVEAALSAFEAERAGQVKLRCIGPLPPCNFLELVITWDD